MAFTALARQAFLLPRRPYSSSSSSFPRSTTIAAASHVKQHAATRGRVRTKPRSNSTSHTHVQTQTQSHSQGQSQPPRPRVIAQKRSPAGLTSTSSSEPSATTAVAPTLVGKGRANRPSPRSHSYTHPQSTITSALPSTDASASSSSNFISITTTTLHTHPNSTMMISKIPSPPSYSFSPVTCYPKSAAYHTAITPSHMPLTLNLDSNIHWPRIVPSASSSSSSSSSSSNSNPISQELAQAQAQAQAEADLEVEAAFGLGLGQDQTQTQSQTQSQAQDGHSSGSGVENKSSEYNPFEIAPRPSPILKLLRKTRSKTGSRSALADHHNVISAFSHPLDAAYLGQPGSSHLYSGTGTGTGTGINVNLNGEVGMTMGEHDTVLARQLGEAGVKWRLSNEMAWEAVLDKLEGKGGQVASSAPGPVPDSAKSSALSATATGTESEEETQAILADPLRQTEEAVLHQASQNRGSVDQAVASLNELLERLDMEEEEGVNGVLMDSVKRKRKKKISKHKYQKRRKATRAQRKRLGK